MLKVPSDKPINFSKDGSYVILEPKEVLCMGIESKISDGTMTGLLTNEHCIMIEFTVDPTGVKVDKIDCCVVVCG